MPPRLAAGTRRKIKISANPASGRPIPAKETATTTVPAVAVSDVPNDDVEMDHEVSASIDVVAEGKTFGILAQKGQIHSAPPLAAIVILGNLNTYWVHYYFCRFSKIK
jgi:hypothetical protein